jgi:hypothetical protein
MKPAVPSSHQPLTDEQRRILSQCLWDMNLTPEEFLAIIEGRSERTWPPRGFCVARLLESVNWFKITRVLDARSLCLLWPDAKRYVRLHEIREGMEYACRVLR